MEQAVQTYLPDIVSTGVCCGFVLATVFNLTARVISTALIPFRRF